MTVKGTGRGFSAANLERGPQEPGEGGPIRSRFARMVAASLILVVLVAQAVLAVHALPDLRWAAAGFLVGLPVTILIFRRPEFGLLLVIALIPLQSLASRHQDPLSLFKILGGLTIVAFLIHWAFRGQPSRLVSAPQNRILLAFAGALVLAAFFTRSTELTLTTLRQLASRFIFYFLAINLITTRRLLRVSTWLILVPMAVSCLIALGSHFLGHNLFSYDYMSRDQTFRAMGTSRDANTYAMTVLVGVPFYFYFLLSAQRRALRLLALAGFGLAVLAVIYTFSRGGAIGLAVVLVALAWGERHRLRGRGLAWTIVGLVVLAGAILPFVPREEYARRLGSLTDWKGDDSLQRRGLYVVFGADIFLHHPIVGIGPGAFPYMMDTDYRLKFPQRLREEKGMGRAAHNLYLELACETGIIGLGAFLWLVGATLRHLRRLVTRYRRDGPADLLMLSRALEVSFWGFLVMSLFLSSIGEKYLWLMLALPVVLQRLGDEAPELRHARVTRPLAAVPLPSSRGIPRG